MRHPSSRFLTLVTILILGFSHPDDGVHDGEFIKRRINRSQLANTSKTWYLIWECVLNVLAELTFFADRGFYADWWNSVSWDQFARDVCIYSGSFFLYPNTSQLVPHTIDF
jgi:hypothetical protein